MTTSTQAATRSSIGLTERHDGLERPFQKFTPQRLMECAS